ncbi:MAG: hypothetical protein BA066_04305 [Candidatus Korarchaeota archaeon NZ13-K]|nr:MAG: hypothetical protein BA066_04305 [Candidatus Korarchaeota archaeon NZ13-K]
MRARLANPSVVWFAVDGGKRILQYDSSNGQVSQVAYMGIRVDTFTPHVGIREKIYFADANGNKIYLYLQPSAPGTTSPSITIVLNHTTYVRCIRFGPDPEFGFEMYFSEASGAGGGLIYRIARNLPQTFMRIDPRDFDGYWAGHFEFGRNDTLYLSSGNRIPSSIYEVRGGRVTKLATFGFPVMGMDYVENARLERLATPGGGVTVSRGLLFADHGSRIYLYDLTNGNLYVIFDDGSYGRIVDVAVPPPRPS